MYKLPVRVEKGVKLISSRMSNLDNKDFVNRELADPLMHILSRQGKMLRPTLVLLGAYAVKEDPMKFVDMAMALELLHVSSLIHDDLIDRDKLRRDIEAIHVKYGDEAAILAGDALISKAIEMSAKYGPETMSAVAKTAIDMCAGEILDSNYQIQKRIPSFETYLEIARLKSASFIGTSCSIVARYKGMRIADDFCNFGKEIGVAFQVRDDIIDYVRADMGFDGSKRRRINIVDTLNAEGKKNALEAAIEINNSYVDRALKILSWKGPLAQLKVYVGFVRVQKEYMKNMQAITELASLL